MSSSTKWARAHPEEHRKDVREWCLAEPGKRRHISRNSARRRRKDPIVKDKIKVYYLSSHAKEKARIRRENLRQETIIAYGGACTCCGEDEFVFLTIDHIDGGGKKDRSINRSQAAFYGKLKKDGWPSGYQVLCWNCNCAKHMHSECPHRRLIRNKLGLRMVLCQSA